MGLLLNRIMQDVLHGGADPPPPCKSESSCMAAQSDPPPPDASARWVARLGLFWLMGWAWLVSADYVAQTDFRSGAHGADTSFCGAYGAVRPPPFLTAPAAPKNQFVTRLRRPNIFWSGAYGAETSFSAALTSQKRTFTRAYDARVTSFQVPTAQNHFSEQQTCPCLPVSS